MNKLSKPASNCRTAELKHDRAVSRRRELGSSGAGVFRSYTNDLARTAKTCQAPFEAKKTAAE
jgi:hypothetical protein